MIRLRSACALLLSAGAGFTQTPATRQVSAAPEDIHAGLVDWPDPAAAALRSRTTLIPVDFELRDGRWVFDVSMPTVRGQAFTLVPMGTHHEEWTIDLRRPAGEWAGVASLIAEDMASIIVGDMPAGAGPVRVEGIQVHPGGAPADGQWRLRISAPKARGERAPRGRVLLSHGGPFRLVSHLTTYRLLSDGPIGIAAYLVDSSAAPASPLLGVVEEAVLSLESSWGRTDVVMLDDGRHDDGDAGDGRFGAYLPRGLSGDMRAVATLRGRTVDGQPIALSGQHAFPVLEPGLLLTGQVTTRVVDDRSLLLDIGAQLFRDVERLHVSGEVWGLDARGTVVPVAWLSRIVTPQRNAANGSALLSLALDGRWLARAGTLHDLELRELRVQDPDTHVLHDFIASISLAPTALPANASGARPTITSDMLMGPSTRSSAGPASRRSLPQGGSLMLVHGYCSGGSIWPAADFDEPKLEFLDPNQNRSHDQFAQLMLAHGSALSSFGVLAHSQGGAAALHLYTYYSSGLDAAQGARRIQTLATPYQGTPLADLGGFACGTNFDLSVSGAAMWLAGIPSWARDEVYYWTTTDAGSACSSLANLFLDDDDNDGTVERLRGQLPGGHGLGHIPGWCHTTGMTYPASYGDSMLNAERNAQASR
ncbi:MAG: hypothetical protein ACI8QZ_000111 [Chlamydiales bacterium]|jgi:hypothetical protein